MSAAGRVLVVDDSLCVRRAIGRMLAPRGLSVTEATAGDQAIELLAEARPDLVICDVMLPGVDGYEVCRFVRARPELAGVPVLLISGVCTAEVERRAAAAGAVGVLAKPFTARSLIARVEDVLAARRAVEAGGGDSSGEALPAGIGSLPGVRAAWLLDAAGGGRRLGGGPLPPAVADLLGRAHDLAAELGFGEPSCLTVEGADGTLVVERFGGEVIAVSFERGVFPGLARHRVRLLRRRTHDAAVRPRGDRNGHHPR
jgi:CheY-like chemotaxis protein